MKMIVEMHTNVIIDKRRSSRDNFSFFDHFSLYIYIYI